MIWFVNLFLGNPTRVAQESALDLWRGGDKHTRFLAGTWWMKVFHGAPVADTG
jgi:hypothetical protein